MGKIIHYSTKPDLTELDPSFMGSSGISGAQYKRGIPENKSSFFYTDDSEPEDVVTDRAPHKYEADSSRYKIYDLDEDKEDLANEARRRNQMAWNEDLFHGLLKEKGYHGVKWTQSPGTKVVQMYDKVPVALAKADNLPTYKVTVNPQHGKELADIYANLKHDPNHPDVKAAYNALINETKDQYKDLIGKGFKFSKMKPGADNPYPSSSHMHNDVEMNKHLHYFPTESGYGNEGDNTSDHPLLQPTEFMDNEGKPMLANDLFRVVHDINGHYHGGKTKFGPKGEHQAYLHHKTMYSPLAQKALAAETLLQNSYVNFGPNGEHNRANPANTIYAEQKATIAPDYVLNGKWHEDHTLTKSHPKDNILSDNPTPKPASKEYEEKSKSWLKAKESKNYWRRLLGKAELKKGQKGDWKKEGYSLTYSHDPNIGQHRITASTKDGNPAGSFIFESTPNGFMATSAQVKPEHQRKGIATSAYKLAESKSGQKLSPHVDRTGENKQSPDAKAFWRNKLNQLNKSVKSPSKHIPLDRLKQIKQDNYVSQSGTDYSQEELDQAISARNQSIGQKMGQMKESDPNANRADYSWMLTPKNYFGAKLKKSNVLPLKPKKEGQMSHNDYFKKKLEKAKQFGSVTVKDPKPQGLGTVKVKEAKPQPTGKVILKSEYFQRLAKNIGAPDATIVAGLRVPQELHAHYLSGDIVPYDHPHRELAAKFVTDVWRKNKAEGARMSEKLLGIGEGGKPTSPNARPQYAIAKNMAAPKYVAVSQSKDFNVHGKPKNPFAGKTLTHVNELKALHDYHGFPVHKDVPHPKASLGEEVYQVHPDGTLKLLHANYDTSD